MITQETNYRQQAKDKLNKEYKDCKGDRCIIAMKGDVLDALLTFAEQDNEFAQAVVQGGSFSDCMKEVAKGVIRDGGVGHIKDVAAYKRAVQFYFKGADISFTMTVKLNPHEESTETAPADSEQKVSDVKKVSALSLSLDDLF